jgi:Flp pilus assembly protein TadD
MHKGFSLNRLMRSDEALVLFDRACSLSPDNPLPWSMKAMIRYGQGDNEQGLKDVDEAIGRDERDPSSWELRAIILRRLGRTAAADEAAAMAKRFDPRRRAER